MYVDNTKPNNTPREIPIMPMIMPCIIKIDWIESLEKPSDINTAMSFCLFKTNSDSEDIMLNDVIAIMSIRIINITLFSLPIAWNNALWVSVQLLEIIEYWLNKSLDIFAALSGSDSLSLI